MFMYGVFDNDLYNALNHSPYQIYTLSMQNNNALQHILKWNNVI